MNCPKCNIEMIEGTMYQGTGIMWRPKAFNKLLLSWDKVLTGSKFFVQAFRCPQCNKIELVAAEIK